MNRREFIGAAASTTVGLISSDPAQQLQAQPIASGLRQPFFPDPLPVDYRRVLPAEMIERFRRQPLVAISPDDLLTDLAWFQVDANGREAYRQALFASPEHVATVYAAYLMARATLRGQRRSARARHWEATVGMFRGNGYSVQTWNDLTVAQGFGWKFPENVGRQQAWIQHHGFYLSVHIPEELLERGRRNRRRASRRRERKAGAQ